MTDAQILERKLAQLLTVQDLSYMFDCTTMTIYNWVEGLGLPTLTIPGRSRNIRRFVYSDVRAWAKQAGKPYRKPPAPASWVAH